MSDEQHSTDLQCYFHYLNGFAYVVECIISNIKMVDFSLKLSIEQVVDLLTKATRVPASKPFESAKNKNCLVRQLTSKIIIMSIRVHSHQCLIIKYEDILWIERICSSLRSLKTLIIHKSGLPMLCHKS